MNKVVWVLVGMIFLASFIVWQRQETGAGCQNCFSQIFPEESQDVETLFVDAVNKQTCLIIEK